MQQLQVSRGSREASCAQGTLSFQGCLPLLCSRSTGKLLSAPNAKANTYTQVGSSSCTRNLQVPWKQKVLWASGQLLKWDLTAAATRGPKSPKGLISFHMGISSKRHSHLLSWVSFFRLFSGRFIKVYSMINSEVSYYAHFTGRKIRPCETPARRQTMVHLSQRGTSTQALDETPLLYAKKIPHLFLKHCC